MRQGKSLQLLSILGSPYFVPVCFAVYLGLRFAMIVGVPVQQHSDELWYYHEAVSLAAGRGYSENGVLTAYWPVGWPGFLSLIFWLVGPSPFIGQLVNWLCSAAIFLLTLRLGATLFKDELVGRLSVDFDDLPKSNCVCPDPRHRGVLRRAVATRYRSTDCGRGPRLAAFRRHVRDRNPDKSADPVAPSDAVRCLVDRLRVRTPVVLPGG